MSSCPGKEPDEMLPPAAARFLALFWKLRAASRAASTSSCLSRMPCVTDEIRSLDTLLDCGLAGLDGTCRRVLEHVADVLPGLMCGGLGGFTCFGDRRGRRAR
jgi:hypothetical protein